MATAEQLKALIQSYAQGDESRFFSVAAQIAAHAARTGRQKLAEEIRRLVDDAKRARDGVDERTAAVPIAQPTGDLAGLIVASYPRTRLDDMVLPSDVHARLLRVIREYRRAEELRAHGLLPRRKLLLVGPPGCGKTMTASAIACELGLPLLVVQFHAMITKFMGETAAKLNLVFQSMRRTRGVYLFDEFDAIGAHRNASNDVGEARRVLNSFLMFLEQDTTGSVVLAATNLAQVLDEALFRRFDDVIIFSKPDASRVRLLVANRLAEFKLGKLAWNRIVAAARGLSHAEIVRACEDAAKEAVLSHRATIRSEELVRALRGRTPTSQR